MNGRPSAAPGGSSKTSLQSDSATHAPAPPSHISALGQKNPELHISTQKPAGASPQMDGQLDPQSVHSCPPQSSPMAQSGAELLLLPHS